MSAAAAPDTHCPPRLPLPGVSGTIGEPSFEPRSPKKKPRQNWGPAEAQVDYGVGAPAPTVGELGMMAVAVKQLDFAVTDCP